MIRITLILSLLLFTGLVSPKQPVGVQIIPVPEASGAVNIGNDRVLVIADEGYDVRIVSKAEGTFKSGTATDFESNMKPAIPVVTVREDKKTLNDIEDVAWDNKRQSAFVITSHSLNTGQEVKPARYKLSRLEFKDGTVDIAHLEVDVLKEALKKKFSFVEAALTQPHETGGDKGTFNIEGLAFDPQSNSLLIGLRSPTVTQDGRPCAVVFTLKNPHDLFQGAKSALPDFDPKVTCLDLGGLGIRGMTYDDEQKGYWIVAGRSDDPAASTHPTPVSSSLWFWDSCQPNRPPRRVMVDSTGLVNLEGVCLLKREGQPGLLLISDDGDETANAVSRYLWIPTPTLLTSGTAE